MTELLSLLRADPEDPEALALYADALLERGDPWGELLALVLAGETEAARRFRFDHRLDLFGDLGDEEDPWRIVGVPPRTVELVVRNYGAHQAELMRQLLERGVLAMVERLVWMGSANFDRLMEPFLANDWPCLRVFRLGPLALGAGRCDVPLDRLATVAPALEELRIPFPGRLDFGHPNLRRLLVLTDAETWSQLDPTRFPRLEHVEVHFREGTPDVRRLQHLRVACARPLEHPNQVAPEREHEGRSALLTPPEQTRERVFVRGDRFWAIRRDGAVLRLRYGKVGSAGRVKEVPGFGPYQASRTYRERVIAKKREGYSERPPE